MKRWFGPKHLGWGIAPQSWEGWLVTVVMIGCFAFGVRWLAPMIAAATGLPSPAATLGLGAVFVALLLGVIALTYDGRKQ